MHSEPRGASQSAVIRFVSGTLLFHSSRSDVETCGPLLLPRRFIRNTWWKGETMRGLTCKPCARCSGCIQLAVMTIPGSCFLCLLWIRPGDQDSMQFMRKSDLFGKLLEAPAARGRIVSCVRKKSNTYPTGASHRVVERELCFTVWLLSPIEPALRTHHPRLSTLIVTGCRKSSAWKTLAGLPHHGLFLWELYAVFAVLDHSAFITLLLVRELDKQNIWCKKLFGTWKSPPGKPFVLSAGSTLKDTVTRWCIPHFISWQRGVKEQTC